MTATIHRLRPPAVPATEHPIKGLGNMLRKAAKPPRQRGELDGYGRCPDCGLDYSANVGVYHCFGCSKGS